MQGDMKKTCLGLGLMAMCLLIPAGRIAGSGLPGEVGYVPSVEVSARPAPDRAAMNEHINRRMEELLEAVGLPLCVICLACLVWVVRMLKARWPGARAMPVGPYPSMAGVLLFMVGYLSFLSGGVVLLQAFTRITPVLAMPLTSLVAQAVALLICLWLLRAALARPPEVLGFHRRLALRSVGFSLGVYAACLPAFYGLMMLSSLIFGQKLQQQVLDIALQKDVLFRGLYFVAVVALAPLLEEVLFRGVLLAVLRRYLGAAGGIVVSALLFMAVHQQPVTFLPLFWLGLVLGFVYHYTGSLAAPVALHALHNGLQFGLILWAVSS